MRKYTTFLTMLTVVIILMLNIIHRKYFSITPVYSWWALPLAFYLISIAGHALLSRAMNSKPEQFMIYFLLSSTVKLLLYLAILLLWFFLSGQTISKTFAGVFILLYLSVTALDMTTVLGSRRKKA
jgi:hypothetical protein